MLQKSIHEIKSCALCGVCTSTTTTVSSMAFTHAEAEENKYSMTCGSGKLARYAFKKAFSFWNIWIVLFLSSLFWSLSPSLSANLTESRHFMS